MKAFSTFTPILSAGQCRLRLGLLNSRQVGRLDPYRRIIPRSTNRAEDDQLDHLSCVGHQRLELLAPGVARDCSHESSRRTLSMLPIQRLTSSSRFASTMAQAAQRNIKTSSSPSFMSGSSSSSVHTSIPSHPQQHLARYKRPIHTTPSTFKAPRLNTKNKMVSTPVNRTSLHPGGVQ